MVGPVAVLDLLVVVDLLVVLSSASLSPPVVPPPVPPPAVVLLVVDAGTEICTLMRSNSELIFWLGDLVRSMVAVLGSAVCACDVDEEDDVVLPAIVPLLDDDVAEPVADVAT